MAGLFGLCEGDTRCFFFFSFFFEEGGSFLGGLKGCKCREQESKLESEGKRFFSTGTVVFGQVV